MGLPDARMQRTSLPRHHASRPPDEHLCCEVPAARSKTATLVSQRRRLPQGPEHFSRRPPQRRNRRPRNKRQSPLLPESLAKDHPARPKTEHRLRTGLKPFPRLAHAKLRAIPPESSEVQELRSRATAQRRRMPFLNHHGRKAPCSFVRSRPPPRNTFVECAPLRTFLRVECPGADAPNRHAGTLVFPPSPRRTATRAWIPR